MNFNSHFSSNAPATSIKFNYRINLEEMTENMKNLVKSELENYKSEIVDSVVGDEDFSWLNGRPLESILDDVRGTFDSIVDEIKNLSAEDIREEIRSDCEEEAETEALETMGLENKEFATPSDEQFFNDLKDRIVERMVKEKLSEYVERAVAAII